MLGETEFMLDIRPTFVDELDKAAAYIERKFKDFLAADRLITDAYDAIDKRLIAPTSFNRAIFRRSLISPTIASTSGTLSTSCAAT